MRGLFSVLVGLFGLIICAENEDSDPLDGLRSSIPGEPGVDYPILASVQETSFSCSGLIFGGYYADPEQECQAYHICLRGPGDLFPVSFLCPNGTLFNQRIFVCDWWFNVDCEGASSLYSAAEGAFGGAGEGDVGECPAASAGSEEECAGAVSNCWSPGQRDTDCPDSGLCCNDGCSNNCIDGPKPQPSQRTLQLEIEEPIKTKPDSTQQNREPLKPQEVIAPVTDPAPTTYRPAFTPLIPKVTTGYTYDTPPPDLQLQFDKPSTPKPGLPFLYGPPSRGRRDTLTKMV